MKVLGLTFGGLHILVDLSFEAKDTFLSVTMRLIGMLTLSIFYKNTETGLVILMPIISYSIFHGNCSLKKADSSSLCIPQRILWLYLLVIVSFLCFQLGCEQLLERRNSPNIPVGHKVILYSSHAVQYGVLSGDGLSPWQNQRKSSHSGEKLNVENN